MEKNKLAFGDFIDTVESGSREFLMGLHQDFLAHGCKTEVKEAKSGYVVSYLCGKKTVANYVFRKAGILVRIYANHIRDYMDFLETLPEGMVKTVQASSVCKRLINPDDCNSKCAMGYDFSLRGEHLQKCRNSAFMFLICEENNSFIKTFLNKELEAYL